MIIDFSEPGPLWQEVVVCGDCSLLHVRWPYGVYVMQLCSRHSAMAAGKPYARPLTQEELMQ